MSDYEYLVADTTPNCHKILEWILAGEAQIRNQSDGTFTQSSYTTLHLGREYRREVSKYLTDPEEIYRAATLGIGQVQLYDGGKWYTSHLTSVDEARESLNKNNKYRIKPGCTLPPKEVLLTDPEEISRGSKAQVVEVKGPCIKDWILSVPLSVHHAKLELSHRNTFRLQHGCTLPPKDVLLTDPEEIYRAATLGMAQVMFFGEDRWDKSDVQSVAEAHGSLTRGNRYRVKSGCTIPPKKEKKWVDREPKDFWPLMGKWWWRYTEGKHRYLIYDSDFPEQSNKEIAKLGTEDWEPMLKVVEE